MADEKEVKKKYCDVCKCEREYRDEVITSGPGGGGADWIQVCNTCDYVIGGPAAWIRKAFNAVKKALLG